MSNHDPYSDHQKPESGDAVEQSCATFWTGSNSTGRGGRGTIQSVEQTIINAHRKHSPWVYLLPSLHVCGCLMLPLGYLVHFVDPQMDYIFGATWGLVGLVDLPLSIVAYLLAWRYSLLAATWIFVAGTWWWYFLSCAIESAVRQFQGHHNRSSVQRLDISTKSAFALKTPGPKSMSSIKAFDRAFGKITGTRNLYRAMR